MLDFFSKTTKAYLDLIIQQYKKPKFMAFVGTKIESRGNTINLDKWREYFDLDTAEKDALDLLGQRANVDRYWSAGILDDDDFRQIIKLKVAVNKSNQSLGSISDIILENFGDFIRVIDNDKMEMVYYVNTSKEQLFNIAFEKKVLPKHAGVSISYIAVPSPYKVFGLENGSENVIGFSIINNDDLKEGHFLSLEDVK